MDKQPAYTMLVRENADLRQRLQDAKRVNGVLRGVLRAMRDEAKTEGFVSWATMDAAREALAQSSETSGSGGDAHAMDADLVEEGAVCKRCREYIGNSALGTPRLCDRCKDTTRATTGERKPLPTAADVKGILKEESAPTDPTGDSQESGEQCLAHDLQRASFQAMEREKGTQESGEALAILGTLVGEACRAATTDTGKAKIKNLESKLRHRLQREEQAQAGVPESVLTKERKAIESAIRFVDERIVPRRCDSDGVSGCWRCQTVYLARTLERLLGEQSNG